MSKYDAEAMCIVRYFRSWAEQVGVPDEIERARKLEAYVDRIAMDNAALRARVASAESYIKELSDYASTQYKRASEYRTRYDVTLSVAKELQAKVRELKEQR